MEAEENPPPLTAVAAPAGLSRCRENHPVFTGSAVEGSQHCRPGSLFGTGETPLPMRVIPALPKVSSLRRHEGDEQLDEQEGILL